MIQAAGILHLCRRLNAPDTVLFVRRAAGGDFPGHWHFPGGRLEPNETPEDAAERETAEECGPTPHGMLIPWTHLTGQQIEYITFLAHVLAEFTVTLNDENTAWCWAPPDAPPLPIHPGCAEALNKLTGASDAALAALAAKIDAAVMASAALARANSAAA